MATFMKSYNLEQIYAFLNSVISLDEARNEVREAYRKAKMSETRLMNNGESQEPVSEEEMQRQVQKDLEYLEFLSFYGFDEKESIERWYQDMCADYDLLSKVRQTEENRKNRRFKQAKKIRDRYYSV